MKGDVPELPDVTIYVEALQARILERTLERVRVASPFLVRSVHPPIQSLERRRITDISRLGKRIVIGFEGDLFLVLHLMIAGRLRWRESGVQLPRKVGLAALDFINGTVLLTEAGSRKQASLHVVDGRSALAEHDRGGLEVLEADLEAFHAVLTRENHTVKRALTDPTLFSGIGNAYSDEILHAAQMSPARLTQRLTTEETARLLEATQRTLRRWTDILRAEAGDGFPEKVTAFRDEMAVHGRYGKPCPVCGTTVQRVVYARNESNYCPRCQTEGRLLSDRSLSRLLKDDWPKTLEELERRRGRR